MLQAEAEATRQREAARAVEEEAKKQQEQIAAAKLQAEKEQKEREKWRRRIAKAKALEAAKQRAEEARAAALMKEKAKDLAEKKVTVHAAQADGWCNTCGSAPCKSAFKRKCVSMRRRRLPRPRQSRTCYSVEGIQSCL